MEYISYYDSPIGKLTLFADENALKGIFTDGQKYYGADFDLSLAKNEDNAIIKGAKKWLSDYFSGKKPNPSEIAISYGKSVFSKTVLGELLEIPYGMTKTYGEIAARTAEKLGKKRVSARAVGGAVGRNPLSIIIPCHRVIGSGGALTGYAGGLEKKIFLLCHEGVTLRENKVCF